MFYKKLISMLLALAMLVSLSCAWAEDAAELGAESRRMSIPDTLYYTGGVVLRTVPRDTSDSDLLQLAYVLTDSPYIIIDQNTTWELTVTGGTAPYEVTALLAWQEDLTMDQFDDPWSTADYFELTGNTFDYSFADAGRYFWQFEVTDSAGQFLSFQTRIYEAYSTADEADSQTVVGKVNSIVSELITDGMSDYSRAKVLHDWIIYNANYDYTFTHYDAAGVLLHGTGVCDSYARAYLMLCTAAGLECLYVSGTAGTDEDTTTWGNHGWNLVKLGGSWYHVDCTWDDPNEGGYERHTYFSVDDETMAKDHRWNQPEDLFDQGGMVVPDAEGGEYESADAAGADYDFTFSYVSEFDQAFSNMVDAGEYRENTVGLYTGSDDLSTVWSEFGAWLGTKVQELANKGLLTAASYSYMGNLFTATITWIDPDDYIRIDEEALRVSIGEKVTIIPSEYVPASNAFTWTSSDPSIATVSASYSSSAGLTAEITGVSAGTATITAASADGLTDSLTVTVLPAYQPDFDLTLTESASGVQLAWNGIPGVTEYRVMRSVGGSASLLASTDGTQITLTAAQLPADVEQQVYIVAVRDVADTVAATYTSEPLTYGELVITYTAILPSGTTEIGAQAFLGDTSLTTVYISDGALTIGSGAFSGCTSLKAVRIPASVTSIASDAFSGCDLVYAEVVKGSYADTWLAENCPSVTCVYK